MQTRLRRRPPYAPSEKPVLRAKALKRIYRFSKEAESSMIPSFVPPIPVIVATRLDLSLL